MQSERFAIRTRSNDWSAKGRAKRRLGRCHETLGQQVEYNDSTYKFPRVNSTFSMAFVSGSRTSTRSNPTNFERFQHEAARFSQSPLPHPRSKMRAGGVSHSRKLGASGWGLRRRKSRSVYRSLAGATRKVRRGLRCGEADWTYLSSRILSYPQGYAASEG